MPNEKQDTYELLRSFQKHVLNEQWSIEGWIQEELPSIDQLDAVCALASTAIDLMFVQLETAKRRREVMGR